VFPHVDAKELASLPSEHTTASIGSTLARLHLASKDDSTLVISRPLDRWTKDKFLSKAQEVHRKIEQIDSPSDFDVMAKEFLQLKILLAEKGSVRFEELGFRDDAVLHGDYHYLNMFFDTEGNVSHLFDFERVRRGDRAAELAYGLFFNCFDLNKTSIDTISEVHFSRAKSYLSAYTKLYPLSAEKVADGIRWYYWSQMVHQLWPLDAHYMEGSTRADDLAPIRFDRLKYFANNLDSVLDILKSYLQ
jgi:Ser/Thr protein kinase RdoA (MazF antagonist)